MGNAILKTGEQTKGRSGISNSTNKDQRRRAKCGSDKPKSDNRIPNPVANVDTKRLNKGNTRNGCESKNTTTSKNKSILEKRNNNKSTASKMNGHESGKKSSSSDERGKRREAHKLPTQQSKLLDTGRMICVPTTRKKDMRGQNLTNDIFLHANDIMAMVDKWKKEEARLQKDYEDTQQKIRVSLRQEHQAKAQAHTWRVQLEKLAHSHRERLFRQATLLRSRLRSAERQMVSTEQKVKGLATANNKLKGLIDQANEKARTVQLQNDRKREEAKRDLKDKLKSVESELEHLTEKIVSSGLMAESRIQNNSRVGYNKSGQTNRLRGPMPKIKEENWKVIPADSIPTAVYELSAIGIPQAYYKYLPGSHSGQMPQFSYNSYASAVVPQSNCSKITSNFVPKRRATAKDRNQQPRASEQRRGRVPVTTTSNVYPAYGQINGNIGGATSSGSCRPMPTVNAKSHRPEADQLLSPPQYCYINSDNTSNPRHGFANLSNRDDGALLNGQSGSSDITSKDQRINPNTADNGSSHVDLIHCDKCHESNQRYVAQQREVYNEFARARDEAAIAKASYELYLSPREYTAINNADYNHNEAIFCQSRDGIGLPFGDGDAATIREDTKATCNCEHLGIKMSTTSPHDLSHSRCLIASDDHHQINSSIATESASTQRFDQGYFGDFERTASSLEVMKRRRIIHRRVATENRTR